MQIPPQTYLKHGLILFAFGLAACGANPATPAAPAQATVAATPAPAAEPAATTAPAAEPTTVAEPATAAAATPAPAAEPTTAPAAAVAKANLNTATQDVLGALPGVGSRMVREFLEYRPYTSILQFRKEIGKYVSADVVAGYEQYVFVPVAINDADAETLKQIPGVDDATAADLIAGRPYATNADFLTRLGTHVSAANTAAAEAYLVTQ